MATIPTIFFDNILAASAGKIQTKVIAGATTAAGVIASLQFNNLVSGRRYIATFKGQLTSNTNEDPSMTFSVNGNPIKKIGFDQTITGTLIEYVAIPVEFTAPASGALTVNKDNATGTIAAGFEITLKEIQTPAITTEWI